MKETKPYLTNSYLESGHLVQTVHQEGLELLQDDWVGRSEVWLAGSAAIPLDWLGPACPGLSAQCDEVPGLQPARSQIQLVPHHLQIQLATTLSMMVKRNDKSRYLKQLPNQSALRIIQQAPLAHPLEVVEDPLERQLLHPLLPHLPTAQ